MTVIAQQDEEARADRRAKIAEALANANRHAKRQQYVIEKFETDPPTQWTKAHRYLDSLLNQYEAT